jgi:hypothetical protein
MSKLNPFHRGGTCQRCGQQFNGFSQSNSEAEKELRWRLGGKWLSVCCVRGGGCGAFMIIDGGQRRDPTPSELEIIREFNAEMNDAGRLKHMKMVEPLFG